MGWTAGHAGGRDGRVPLGVTQFTVEPSSFGGGRGLPAQGHLDRILGLGPQDAQAHVGAGRVLRRVKGIAICRLTSADVVRHPLVARIVDAYDKP